MQSDISTTLRERNKIKIHIETAKLFFDNVNCGESIHKFLLAQQDTSKKLLNIEYETSDAYNEYITEYLAAINNIYDDKCDIIFVVKQKF